MSLAATQSGIQRLRPVPNVRHALVSGLVDPRAMTFAEDEIDYERIRRAARAHIRGDERRIVLSCSVYNGFAARLGRDLGVPVERSDDAGAHAVVELGPRIGLAVSYPPSYAIVERHLTALADQERRAIELEPLLDDNAFAFAADAPRYARAILDATFAARDLDAIFLAQYSMDPVAPLVGERSTIPVISALEATLSRL